MSNPDDLDSALDAVAGSGRATIDSEGVQTHVDVTEVGPIGVRIRGISVGHAHAENLFRYRLNFLFLLFYKQFVPFHFTCCLHYDKQCADAQYCYSKTGKPLKEERV